MNSEAQQRYEQLARRFEAEGEQRRRDDCLVLAADAALTNGRLDEAERLRQVLLRGNPYHLLCPYESMSEALQSGDVRDYIAALRRQLSPERAEQMLKQKSNGMEEPLYKVVPQTSTPTPHEITPIPEPPPRPPRIALPAPARQSMPAVRPSVPKAPAPTRHTASPTAAPAEPRPPTADAATPAGRLAARFLFLIGVILAGAACFFAFVRPFFD